MANETVDLTIETQVNGAESSLSTMSEMATSTLETLIASQGLGETLTTLQSLFSSFDAGNVTSKLKPFETQLQNIKTYLDTISSKLGTSDFSQVQQPSSSSGKGLLAKASAIRSENLGSGLYAKGIAINVKDFANVFGNNYHSSGNIASVFQNAFESFRDTLSIGMKEAINTASSFFSKGKETTARKIYDIPKKDFTENTSSSKEQETKVEETVDEITEDITNSCLERARKYINKAIQENNRHLTTDEKNKIFDDDVIRNFDEQIKQKQDQLKNLKSNSISESTAKLIKQWESEISKKVSDLSNKANKGTVSYSVDGEIVLQEVPVFHYGKDIEGKGKILSETMAQLENLAKALDSQDIDVLNEEEWKNHLKKIEKVQTLLNQVESLSSNIALATSNHKNVNAARTYESMQALQNSGLFADNENAKAVRNIVKATYAEQRELEESLKNTTIAKKNYVSQTNKEINAYEESVKAIERKNNKIRKESEIYAKYNGSDSSFDNFKTTLREYNKRILSSRGISGFAARALDRSTRDSKHGDMWQKTDSAGNLIKGSGVNLNSVGIVAAATAVTKLGKACLELGKNALRAFGEIESIKVNLGVVYGNQSEASMAFDEIAQYAKKSPFGVQTVSEFAVLLKQSGVYASDLMNTLKMIGDVSGGNEEKMKRIANNYAQIIAMGKANSIDLRQFANAGIPIYEMLRDELKVDQTTLRQKSAAGEITSDVVEKVFRKMTSEGGRFYNAVEKGADTYKAKVQNLSDAKQLAYAEGGEWIYNSFGIKGIIGLLDSALGGVEGVFDNRNTKRDLKSSNNFKKNFDNLRTSQNILTYAINSNSSIIENNSDMVDALNSTITDYYMKGKDTQRSTEAERYYELFNKQENNLKNLNLLNSVIPITETERKLLLENAQILYKNSNDGWDNAIAVARFLTSDFTRKITGTAPLDGVISEEIRKSIAKNNVLFNQQNGIVFQYGKSLGLSEKEVGYALINLLTNSNYIQDQQRNNSALSKKEREEMNNLFGSAMEYNAIKTASNIGEYYKKYTTSPNSITATTINSKLSSEYKNTDEYKLEEAKQTKEIYEKAKQMLDLQKQLGIGNNLNWLRNKKDTPPLSSVLSSLRAFYTGDTINVAAESMTNDDKDKLLSNINNIRSYMKANNRTKDYAYLLDDLLNYQANGSARTVGDLLRRKDFNKGNAYLNNQFIGQGLGVLANNIDKIQDDDIKQLLKTIFIDPLATVVDEKQLNASLKSVQKKFTPFWKRFTSSILDISIDSFDNEIDVFKRYTDKVSRDLNTSIYKGMLQSGDYNIGRFLVRNADGDISQFGTSLNLQHYALGANSSANVTQAYLQSLQQERETLLNFTSGKYFQREDLDKLWDTEWAKNLGYKGKEDFVSAFGGSQKKVEKAKKAIENNTLALLKNTEAKITETLTLSNLKTSLNNLINQNKNTVLTKQAREALSKTSYGKNFDSESLDSLVDLIINDTKDEEGNIDSKKALRLINGVGSYSKLYDATQSEKTANEAALKTARENLGGKEDELKTSQKRLNKYKLLQSYNQLKKDYGIDLANISSQEKERLLATYNDAYFNNIRYNSYIRSSDKNTKLHQIKKTIDTVNVKRKFQAINIPSNIDELVRAEEEKQTALKSEIEDINENITRLTESDKKLASDLAKVDTDRVYSNIYGEQKKAQSYKYEELYNVYNPTQNAFPSNNAVGNYIASTFGYGEYFPITEGGNSVKQQKFLNAVGAPKGTSFEEFANVNKQSIVSEYQKWKGYDNDEMKDKFGTDENGNLLTDTANIEKMADAMYRFKDSTEKAKDAMMELGSSLQGALKSSIADGFNNSMQALGKNLALGSDASDDMADAWKNAGKAMLEQMGTAATTAGLNLISAGAINKNWAMLAAGVGLVATGGIMNIGFGALSAESDDDDDAEQQANRLKDLKEDLADLLEQAKLDAEYYLKNTRHKDALSAISVKEVSNQSVNDAIITPNGNVISTHPDDYLIATKTPDTLVNSNRQYSSGMEVTFAPSINVINETGQNFNVETSQRSNGNGETEFDVIIKSIVGTAIADGSLDGAFSKQSQRLNGRSVAF